MQTFDLSKQKFLISIVLRLEIIQIILRSTETNKQKINKQFNKTVDVFKRDNTKTEQNT